MNVLARGREALGERPLVHVARFLGLYLVIGLTGATSFFISALVDGWPLASLPEVLKGIVFLGALGGWLPALVLTSAWAGAGRAGPRVMTDGGKRGGRAREAVSRKKQAASRQVRGTASNARYLVGSFTFDQILPNSIAGFLGELMALFPRALGRGSPKQQVYASVTLILIAIISTPFTLGYSLILAAPFAFTLLIGLWRLVPAANSAFSRARGKKLRDRDVPLWRRE